MTKLPNLQTDPAEAPATSSFTRTGAAHPRWLGCAGAMRADQLSGGL